MTLIDREAAAKVCDEIAAYQVRDSGRSAAKHCATAIRSMTPEPDALAARPADGNALMAQAIGWMYSYACIALDEGKDLRQITVPEIWEQAQRDLSGGHAAQTTREWWLDKNQLAAETDRCLMAELQKLPNAQTAQEPDGQEAVAEKCEESIRQQSEAWEAVADTLHTVSPGWMNGPGNGEVCAVEAIRKLARGHGCREALTDAQRYRWLRNPDRLHTITVERWSPLPRATLHGETLDANIDAAICADAGTQKPPSGEK